jgi:hypothetical protein
MCSFHVRNTTPPQADKQVAVRSSHTNKCVVLVSAAAAAAAAALARVDSSAEFELHTAENELLRTASGSECSVTCVSSSAA